MKQRCRIGKLNIVVLILMILVSVCGCNYSSTATVNDSPQITEVVKKQSKNFDSIDTNAIVMSVNLSKNAVTLLNQQVKKAYTLYYDGTSKICDKYGTSMVMEQINPGDVVNVEFIKEQRLIYSLNKSEEAWVYEGVNDFEINSLTKSMKINGGDYRFSDALKIFSEGKEAQLIDINSCDILTISGNDHEVYSIVISKGHGYLRLQGQQFFEGGWIEVGSRIIKTVTKEMLIAVPVGEYEVKLSNGKYEGNRRVNIKKNQETELDVSDMIELEEDTEGTLILVIEPAGAMVYIDGSEVDINKPISIEFGIHQLIAKAEGYKTLTQYFKVDQENATLDITMEKSKSLTEIDESGAASPAAEVTTFITEAVTAGSTDGYRVYISSPDGAEVYVDGVYVGVVPTSFAKTEITRVITLRKDGYVTRSYTINLDGTAKDETFSFAALDKDTEDGKEDSNSDTQNDDENAENP